MIPRRQCAFVSALIAAAIFLDGRGPAADAPLSAADGDAHARLQRNLEAFYRLSPEMQARVRELDRALAAEDAATRQRLIGVMQRYAGWVQRLPPADRDRIAAAPPGPERLRIVRETLDQQWFAALPKAYRDEYAAKPAERAALLEKWKAEDRDRRAARDDALPDWSAMGLPPGLREIRDEINRYVREVLEPRLSEREKKRLQGALNISYRNYLTQVASLSESKNLRPPGPPEAWRRLSERRPRIPPP
jgi:hypothetical protein